MNSVDKALTKSQQAFIDYVEPLIRQKLQPEYLHRCEGHKQGLEAKLDRDYGTETKLRQPASEKLFGSRLKKTTRFTTQIMKEGILK